MWIHRDLVFRGVPNESLGIRKRNIGWGCSVALVVGNDLDPIILPDSDATGWVR